MLTTEKVIALIRWIKNWRKTYGENPTLDECVTWVEWQFECTSISKSEKKSIQQVLSSNLF